MVERDSQINFKSENMEEQLIPQTESNKTADNHNKKNTRLNSLDLLRGFTILGMTLVDCKGDNAPWFIQHASWDGLTPADLIFPSFIFILGMAVPLALSKNKPIRPKAIIRIFALFAIGLFLNLIDEKFEWFRIPGILQKMSICYAILVCIHIITRYGQKQYRMIGSVIAMGLGLVYLSLMLSYENQSQGCNKYNNLTQKCNYGHYFDVLVAGQDHVASDPEGIFVSLSSFWSAYFGYIFCLVMLDFKDNLKKTLILWTTLSLLIGSLVYPLTFIMPINKKLWSISFVFITSAITGLSLVLVTVLFDVLGKQYERYGKIVTKVTQPLLWLGLNPLAIYVLMQLVEFFYSEYIIINDQSLKKHFEHFLTSIFGSEQVSATVLGVIFVFVWTAVAGVMYKYKIFLRL